MIIFLYGEDTYRSRQKLNEIMRHFGFPAIANSKKKGVDLASFGDGNLDFQDFKKELDNPSIFKEKKIVILKDVFSNKNFKEEFLEQGERFARADAMILILEENNFDKRDSLYKFFLKKAKVQEFNLLTGEKLADWVEKKLNDCKIESEPDVPQKLILFIGNDLWRMENEINKLASYSGGKRINVKDVELLIKSDIGSDIFKTIDSLAENKKETALHLMHKHLEDGDSPLYLLSMISFQFRNMLEIKDLTEKNTPYYEILRKSKLHPFVIKKTHWQIQKFTLSCLKKIYRKIFQVDLAIKTGKMDPETALDLFIAEI